MSTVCTVISEEKTVLQTFLFYCEYAYMAPLTLSIIPVLETSTIRKQNNTQLSAADPLMNPKYVRVSVKAINMKVIQTI
jgi:hypothetical protein